MNNRQDINNKEDVIEATNTISTDELGQLKLSHADLHFKEQFFLSDGDIPAYFQVESEIDLMHDLMTNMYNEEVNDDLVYENIASLIDSNQQSSPALKSSLQTSSIFAVTPTSQPIAPPNTPVLDEAKQSPVISSPRLV